jgi:hypothetical protein
VDDGALLERTRRGDAEAFSLLFARYQGPIFRLMIPGPATAH